MRAKFIGRQNVLPFSCFIPLKRSNAFHRQADKIPDVLCVEQGHINMEIWVVH